MLEHPAMALHSYEINSNESLQLCSNFTSFGASKIEASMGLEPMTFAKPVQMLYHLSYD